MWIMMKVAILASIINAECGVCPTNEQYLVGSTVLNRMDSNLYPGTLDSVVHQKWQYNGAKTKLYKPTRKTVRVAIDLLNGRGRDYNVMSFSKSKKNNYLYKMKYHYFK